MKVRFIVVTVLVLAAAMTISPSRIDAQETTSYEIAGITAWNTSKTYGFVFHPERASDESLTNPRDGMNTRLTKRVATLLGTQTVAIAQVVGGQPSVMPGQRNTTFTFFGGRTLQPGWTVKSVDVGGNFTYVQQARLNTSDLSFRVRLAPGGTATLRKVVLTGPSGADWKDAFSAPVRKDYVVNGVVAWGFAKKYGFTFKPDATIAGRTSMLSAPVDGVFTVVYFYPELAMGNCTPWPHSPTRSCILAQIVGGNMSVPPPFSSPSRGGTFEMFGGKKLSPGWIVKAIDVSNGTLTTQPQAGSDNLRFVVQLTAYAPNGATAIVRSITLEGPSNAASVEDAFRNAQNP